MTPFWKGFWQGFFFCLGCEITLCLLALGVAFLLACVLACRYPGEIHPDRR